MVLAQSLEGFFAEIALGCQKNTRGAVGEVSIRIEQDGRQYIGRGADTDIIVASAKAYMNALNRLLSMGDISRSPEAATAV